MQYQYRRYRNAVNVTKSRDASGRLFYSQLGRDSTKKKLDDRLRISFGKHRCASAFAARQAVDLIPTRSVSFEVAHC